MSWLFGGVLSVLMAVGYWWLKRPVYYKSVPLIGVEHFLSDLFQYFADGSILYVEHPGSLRFVQFVKYVDDQGHPKLHFSFPEADWSAPCFTKIAAALQAAGVVYRVRDTTQPLCPRFLDVDGVTDPQLAFLVTRAVLSAMGFGESDTFRIHFRGHHDPGAARSYVRSQMVKRRTKQGPS